MAAKSGSEFKFYRNSGTYGSPNWVLVGNTRDLTINGETGEIDVTTRGNNGWKATIPGLKDGSIEFEMVWDSEDANFAAFQAAWINKTPIEVAAMSDAIDTAGSTGLRATMAVTRFSQNEPLEDAVTASVTLKPTYADYPPAIITV